LMPHAVPAWSRSRPATTAASSGSTTSRCTRSSLTRPRKAARRTEELMQTRGEFSVSVTKDYLVFASAHFITFAGHRCEGLHGHNYRARVTIDGALDEESWFVFDFVV